MGWVIGIWVLTLLVIPLTVIVTARRQAIVIARLQKDAPPFWERNRDQIAINAIFTVIGGVLRRRPKTIPCRNVGDGKSVGAKVLGVLGSFKYSSM
jgi:hypothetical protein